jgi:hypothetical protein
MSAKFKKVVMLSSTYENAQAMDKYLTKVSGVFRPAPQEVSNAVGGPCGVLLVVNSNGNSVASRSVDDEVSATSKSQRKSMSKKSVPSAASFEGDEESDLDDDDVMRIPSLLPVSVSASVLCMCMLTATLYCGTG